MGRRKLTTEERILRLTPKVIKRVEKVLDSDAKPTDFMFKIMKFVIDFAVRHELSDSKKRPEGMDDIIKGME